MTCPLAHIAVADAAHGLSEASGQPTISKARPSGPAPRMLMTQISGIESAIRSRASRIRFRSETNRQRYIETQMTLARCLPEDS